VVRFGGTSRGSVASYTSNTRRQFGVLVQGTNAQIVENR